MHINASTDSILKKVLLKAPQARVWRALVDSREFGLRFGVKFDGPFVPGASLRGRIVPTSVDAEVGAMQKKYERTAFEILVEKVEPERLFSFRWHPGMKEKGVDFASEPPTLVQFELTKVEGGVLLTVTESGFDMIPLARRATAFGANEQGWSKQMELIEKYLAQTP